ncbi:gamma-glutamyl-gamma-aminobutyrate hydrolase family protein [Candidatus Saccharibacteria bacterium]|nr:gamma-glutamyl-gamma-aminobutyrate hydrolase family protein [Candidatus Saccharibacteria bacterium]
MKFCVINNGSLYLDNILARLSENHSYHLVDYSPYHKIDIGNADMVILSGGMTHEVDDLMTDGTYYFQEQFNLINSCPVPIFGICLGLQMMTVACGGKLKIMPKMVHENKVINLNLLGLKELGEGDLFVHKRHQIIAHNPENNGFEILASSSEGPEIIKHVNRQLLGVQFHPEIDVDHKTEQEFWRLLSLLEPSLSEKGVYA